MWCWSRWCFGNLDRVWRTSTERLCADTYLYQRPSFCHCPAMKRLPILMLSLMPVVFLASAADCKGPSQSPADQSFKVKDGFRFCQELLGRAAFHGQRLAE